MARCYRLERSVFEELRARAEKAARTGRELCGVLAGRGVWIGQVFWCPCLGGGSVILDPEGLASIRARIRERKLTFLGFLRSHAQGRARPVAAELHGFSGALVLIYDVRRREARLWRLAADAGDAPEEKEFVFLEG